MVEATLPLPERQAWRQQAVMPLAEPLHSAFRAEELAGIRMSTYALLTVCAALAVMIGVIKPPGALYYQYFVGLFAVLTVVNDALNHSRFNRPWLDYLYVTLIFALLTVMFFTPNPFIRHEMPPQVRLSSTPVLFYFTFLMPVALRYSPPLMLWAGLVGALSWSAGVIWVVTLPDTITAHPQALPFEEHVALHDNIRFVDIPTRVWEVTVMLLVAGVLAAVVWRSRRLVVRQSALARQRANLARYFSPNVLDEVMGVDGPLTTVRKHNVAVLFADIVGFTPICETMPPEQVMAMLREYHTRLEEAVFRFGGTLDKFIGDAVMASFGAPRPGSLDATQSLRCARAMLHTMAAWNQQRQAAGEVPIRIGIGVHYGPAVMGDVGSARCAAFAVIGDTTNTTSRLQGLTRTLATDMVVSAALLHAVQRETPEAREELAGLQEAGPQALRGRTEAIQVWALRAY